MTGVPWIDWALKEVGTRETPGPRHAKRVLDYWRIAGIDWINDDETPWCAAFVAAAMKACGGALPKAFWRARAWAEDRKSVV